MGDAESVSEQADTNHLKADDKQEQDKPDAVAKKPEVRKPLDLSMPPQPKGDLDSLDGKRTSTEQLLPDLFEQEEKSDERSLGLKGRVLMEQTGQEDLNSIEGGEIIIEMKTPQVSTNVRFQPVIPVAVPEAKGAAGCCER